MAQTMGIACHGLIGIFFLLYAFFVGGRGVSYITRTESREKGKKENDSVDENTQRAGKGGRKRMKTFFLIFYTHTRTSQIMKKKE